MIERKKKEDHFSLSFGYILYIKRSNQTTKNRITRRCFDDDAPSFCHDYDDDDDDVYILSSPLLLFDHDLIFNFFLFLVLSSSSSSNWYVTSSSSTLRIVLHRLLSFVKKEKKT